MRELEDSLRNEKKSHRLCRRLSNRRKQALLKKSRGVQRKDFKRKQESHITTKDKKLLLAVKQNPFLLESVENSLKNKHARRYKHTRRMATILKISSTSAYKSLREAGSIILPHPKTVGRWWSHISWKPGFNKSILRKIKKESKSMSDKEKTVILLIDGMAIKENINYHARSDVIHGFPDDGQSPGCESNNQNNLANEAIVVMIRSLYTQYKQVIGYFLANASLGHARQKEIVIEAILHLKHSGFHPVAIVMDQHTTNTKMAEELGVSTQKPFFVVDEMRIAVMYDIPHLFKSLRNNLYAKNMLVDNEIISFKYIKDLYYQDVLKVPRLVPRLLKSNIILNTFSKMNVRKATRTLSRSTAKGIQAYINLGLLPQTADPTAEFVLLIDSYYDVFNSRFRTDKLKVSKYEYMFYIYI